MVLPGVSLDRPVVVPVDNGPITARGRFQALNFAYPGPALRTTWREMLSCALRVGRANWLTQLQAFWPARYEAGRRVMHLLSHLEEQTFGNDQGLVRSDIFKDEDGSEKTFSSYAIGMALCQTYATNAMGMPPLAHYDAVHGATGTRPDLVHPVANDQVFVEAKGRYKRLRREAMVNAVEQLFAHPFAPTPMTLGVATASCFQTQTFRLSMHVRVWNPNQAPLGWLAARDADQDLPADPLSVVAAHLLGVGLASDDAEGLFTRQLDGENFICARESRTGLILGLSEEDCIRGWLFASQYGVRRAPIDRLLADAHAGDAKAQGNASKDLKVSHRLALGWPDSIAVG